MTIGDNTEVQLRGIIERAAAAAFAATGEGYNAERGPEVDSFLDRSDLWARLARDLVD